MSVVAVFATLLCLANVAFAVGGGLVWHAHPAIIALNVAATFASGLVTLLAWSDVLERRRWR